MHATVNDLDVLMQDGAGGSLRGTDWDGFATNINELAPGTDFGPLLAQLPGGDCPVPHWGYMIEGSITVHYRDGDEETVDAGQVFHLPAHHDRLVTATGALYAEFSPADTAHRLLAEVARATGVGKPDQDHQQSRPSNNTEGGSMLTRILTRLSVINGAFGGPPTLHRDHVGEDAGPADPAGDGTHCAAHHHPLMELS